MRAVQLTGPEQMEIVDIPEVHAGEGEVLLEMKACSICNQHDMHMFRGGAGMEKGYPAKAGSPGHEGTGVVVEVGKDVEGMEIGDHVVATGTGGPPLYREYVTRRGDTVAKVAKDIPFTSACALELFACARHGIEWADKLAGKRVGVVGLGPAGLAVMELLHVEAPRAIIGFDLQEERRTFALEFGADEIIDPAPCMPAHRAAVRMVREENISDEEKAVLAAVTAFDIDTVIDCTGHPDGVSFSFLLAKKELVIFGYVRDETKCLPSLWFAKELAIKNTRVLNFANLRTVALLASEKVIDPGKIVTHVLPFERYTDGLDLVKAGKAVKVALVWDEVTEQSRGGM